MNLLDALILSIVEGITEFLPISSTGHMILTSHLLGLENSEFLKTFEISIQLGAILAIAVMYIKRFFNGIEIYRKLFVAFLPTATIGFLMYKIIKAYLFNSWVVSFSLILGGLLLIIWDKKLKEAKSNVVELESISYKNAFYIGFIQCLSIIPGVSRAGASIIGGIFNGLNRNQATEFSFLLAVPTMLAATTYDLLKTPLHFNSEQLTLLSVGLIGAFISAWIAVRFLIRHLKQHGFGVFGWYRIALGLLFLILLSCSVI
ncbi:MAG: undecaprenyl-diphosphate phosphatase [Saprospiraceae bacterium]|nr:undecaprenyl-diphosphate phosphatase [Saprospiraceae bacterium]MBK7738675.1 undecaprenyl-diphosphate phosphatase [Saprospiraceae bacterium]MBK7912753.1 undecaprenyl-diphosphate phosphatase [Saprospiraceae bacterium]